MQRQIKTYEWVCDQCRKETIVQGEKKPEGWGTRTVYDCGLTGYTSHDDLCPDCWKKHKERNQ